MGIPFYWEDLCVRNALDKSTWGARRKAHENMEEEFLCLAIPCSFLSVPSVMTMPTGKYLQNAAGFSQSNSLHPKVNLELK